MAKYTRAHRYGARSIAQTECRVLTCNREERERVKVRDIEHIETRRQNDARVSVLTIVIVSVTTLCGVHFTLYKYQVCE